MNTYFCTDCASPADPPRCPQCRSHTVHMAGDLHLTMIGLDTYVNIFKDALGAYYLIIKKPSGQREVRLQDVDLIGTPVTFDHQAKLEAQIEVEEEEYLAGLVELDHADLDPGQHFMDDDGRPKGYELEQHQAEMERGPQGEDVPWGLYNTVEEER